ncbi:LysR family transcriptional regulator, partial [Escherichia coli]|nr:LysR family transcriptional regulator [Escherichia coli]
MNISWGGVACLALSRRACCRISQHIKQLEALVGVTLFIRHGRGVRITEEGRLYALQIREALQHIADATRMVQIKPRTLEVSLAT